MFVLSKQGAFSVVLRHDQLFANARDFSTAWAGDIDPRQLPCHRSLGIVAGEEEWFGVVAVVSLLVHHHN